MTRLVFKDDFDIRYPEDVARIVEVLERAGYEISPQDAAKAWEAYSETSCASWLMLPDDDEILEIQVKSCLHEEEI